MKEIKNVTLYKCDFCGKEYKRKHACITHEERCGSNPKNDRACFNCDNIHKTKVSIYFENGYGEWEEDREILYCDEVKTFLYPPSVERKGNSFLQEDINDGEIENNPMPKECIYCQPF